MYTRLKLLKVNTSMWFNKQTRQYIYIYIYIYMCDKFTVKMVLPEDGNNEGQNASEQQSNSVTSCALSAGLIEDKIKYDHNAWYVQY